jgi:hypothetical protein
MQGKKILTAVMQIDGGDSTPPPCTNSNSSGARELQEHGG